MIDQEHETLFQLTNTLLDQVALRRQQPTVFEAAFESLLRARALHLAAQARDAQGATEGELIKFLVTELVVGHMLHADRAFFAWFASPGAQTLAAPKFSGI